MIRAFWSGVRTAEERSGVADLPAPDAHAGAQLPAEIGSSVAHPPAQIRTSTSDLRELLAAVLEAIDLPHPATVGGQPVHRELLATRVMHASIALREVLTDGVGSGADPAWQAAYLRRKLAEHPADGYQHWSGR
jgi:hypothetical protein